ncbi:CHRD domain-containing protein [Siccirubricoccus deserti]
MAHDTFVQDGKLLYSTEFTALNNSGVAGRAVLLLDQNAQTLTVDIQATGLEADQMHIQHIHGFADDKDAMTPTIALDDDGDGFVELVEGLAAYGPIQLNLTLDPASAAHDHGTEGHDHTAEAVFPTVGADGVLSYRETFHFDASDPNAQVILDGITPLEFKEIVLHGMTTTARQGQGTEGEVDGTAGYKLVLPIASGELMGVASAADVLGAVDHLGLEYGEVVDWQAIGDQVIADFEATGQWFI